MGVLPNWKHAVIPEGKLEHYCLNPFHPKGKDKARVFKSVLGFTEKDAYLLEKLILTEIAHFEAIFVDSIDWGELWRVDIEIAKENEKILLRTNWIIKYANNYPSLVSCFIKI
jgi:hypothetical protein